MPSISQAKPGSLSFTTATIRIFRASLLAWFDLHKRDLPWRRTRDPYAIWVSEIMLQQTRVAAVLDHYGRWMARFPTVEALAAAPEDEVLAAWSGLGYYRRARFLHRASKAVVADHGCTLPRAAAELRKLPGIGDYTSSAIASIAFGEAAAAVDGNVERVLRRQTGTGENGAAAPPNNGSQNHHPSLNVTQMQALASRLIDPRRPGDFNQAMMELGATVCLPRAPLCLQCPVQKSCRTRGEHPVAARKAALYVDLAYALVRRRKNGAAHVLLQQRASDASVMPRMWELPLLMANDAPGEVVLILRHSIMQTNYRVSVVEVIEKPKSSKAKNAINSKWIEASHLSELPLTGLARKILLRLGLLLRP